MERILNDSEKIRRAEEIYYRRNNRNASIASSRISEQSKTKTYLGSKIMLEMLVLLLSALIVFAVKNKDYIFTKEFLAGCEQYNINLTEKFSSITNFFAEDISSEEIFINNTVENIKSEDNEQIIEKTAEPTQAQISQNIVTDSQALKNNYNLIKPIEGIVTSGFGERESTNKKVTNNHTGIDISAVSGTHIKSAMNGTVVKVSSDGDYGNHVKICKDNVTTLYAHCKEIFVIEGQEILQGQEIASVGSTGNSTGPHLHFEIRLDDIPINPAEIIQF